MKKNALLITLLISLASKIQAQSVAINTSGAIANTSSILDVTSTTKGMLIPRLSAAQRIAVAAPVNGLLVYDTDSLAFSYYTGTTWIFLKGTTNIDNHWSTKGNANTDTAVNFLGTKNDMPLRFKINNQWAGQWDAKYSNYFIGTNSGINAIPNPNPSANVGKCNIGIGDSVLLRNVYGASNVGIGEKALYSNLSSFNIAIGQHTLRYNTSGTFNIAIGSYSQATSSVTDDNLSIGYFSLGNNRGNSNIAFGKFTMSFNNGDNNVAIGNDALHSNNTGNNNTGIGVGALYENTDGSNNIANGYQALYDNTIGENNISNGYRSLYHNTTGINNIANGYQALRTNTIGQSNIANGYFALYNNLDGNYNIANGYQAMYANTSGEYNIASGWIALTSNNSGNNNIAFGRRSLEVNTSGNNNVAIGARALEATTTTDNNTAAGAFALQTPSAGNNNSAFGYSADVTLVSATNATALGYNATAPASNYVRIGNTGVTAIVGQVAFSPSDGRFKTNVQDNVPGLNFIMGLRPVTYHFEKGQYSKHIGEKQDENYVQTLLQQDAVGKTSTGFIAQEVDALAKKLNYDFDGLYKPQNDKDAYAIGYQQFVTPMIKAMQEQQKIIEEQQKIIDIQQATLLQIQKDLKELKSRE